MVSVIIQQAKERERKIRIVIDTLRRNPDANMKEFIIETSVMFGCSVSKAREYINIAKWRLENENISG